MSAIRCPRCKATTSLQRHPGYIRLECCGCGQVTDMAPPKDLPPAKPPAPAIRNLSDLQKAHPLWLKAKPQEDDSTLGPPNDD